MWFQNGQNKPIPSHVLIMELLWNDTTDLLHLGIEVGVAICDNELDCFISYLFIRGFHGDAPDKIHPCQVKALHTLKE